MKTLSQELTEAALVDGASLWTIYRKVILPLCRPALAALATLEFTFIYNDFFWALILMRPATSGRSPRPSTTSRARSSRTRTCSPRCRSSWRADGRRVPRALEAVHPRPDPRVDQGLIAAGASRGQSRRAPRRFGSIMTPQPWADPELTSSGRLPMHAVPHDDRLPLDGTWRFQLLTAPDEAPGDGVGRGRRPRLLDDAGHVGPADLHQRPDAVPRSPARDARGEPDRRLRAVVRGPGRLGRASGSCSTSGRPRACCWSSSTGRTSGSARTRTSRPSSTSPTLLRPGANDLRLTVVKWSDASFIEDQDQWWHGGITRPVFLYATGSTYLADLVVDAGLAADGTTGTLALEVGRRLGRHRGPTPGWRVEAEVEGGRAPMAGDVAPRPAAARHTGRLVRPGPPRRGVVDLQSLNAAGALTAPDDVARWREAEPVVRPTRVGRVRLATEVAGRRARGRRRCRRCTGSRSASSRPTAPSPSGSSAGSGSGGWRSAASSCSSTGAPSSSAA